MIDKTALKIYQQKPKNAFLLIVKTHYTINYMAGGR